MGKMLLAGTENGMFLLSLDNSQIAFVNLILGREAFKEFECDRNESLCVNMKYVKQILGSITETQSLTLIVETGSDELLFVVENNDGEVIEQYNCKLLNPDEPKTIPVSKWKLYLQPYT